MAKLPNPPGTVELARRAPAEVHRLPGGTLLARIYARGGRHPSVWSAFRTDGPLGGRFDHHDPSHPEQRRGVLYGAVEVSTCVAEVFGDTRVLDRAAAERCVAAFRTTRALALLDLGGEWPTRAGASQAISSGPRPRAQRWECAIYDAYPQVDGLWYPASMRGGGMAFALLERAEDALPAGPELDLVLTHPGLLPDLVRITDRLGYLLR